jgi:arsenate reductase-like glutaredoxin family protein
MPDPRPEPILYTQPGCTESARVRAWLTDHEIAFTERDATREVEAAQALAATGTFATPLLVVGGEKVLGFRPDQLESILETDQHEP